MDQQFPKPHNADELRRVLSIKRGDFGRGGRRLANFIIDNLDQTAMLPSSEVAKRCNVHASTVVRLAQSLGFAGYRELQAVLQFQLSNSLLESKRASAQRALGADISCPLRVHLFADSGRSFNEAAGQASKVYCSKNPGVEIVSELHVSYEVDPVALARNVEASAEMSDGIILVAREHPAINEAVRTVTARGIPVICLTTDLPASGRTAYVGSDQYASGATAGWLCGRMLPREEEGRVLFICSVPFRCHQEREQGFRQVLRSEFSWLGIDEKVSSNESIEVIYESVRRYIAKSGAPAAIYNVSGANLGVGKALEDEGLSDKVIFIGHELNVNSRSLLERGIMDIAIGHDIEHEIDLSVDCIKSAIKGVQPVNCLSQSQLFTRFNCSIF